MFGKSGCMLQRGEVDEHGVVIPYDCVHQQPSPRSDAVKQFVARHADEITGVLSGFDRLIFRGHLQALNYDGGVRGFLDRQQVLLKEFEKFAKVMTALVRDGAEEVVRAHGRPIHKLESSRLSKEEIARAILRDNPIRTGPICLMPILEPCSTWQVWRSRERAHPQEVRRKSGKCLHLYTYFVDPEFGFGHVRLQTWMPYTVQVYINGREWLGRQLDRARMAYRRADNCFPYLADPLRAQRIFEGMLDLPWQQLLDDLIVRMNPALATVIDAVGAGYYWVCHQSEWASDVMYRDANRLAACYPDLLRYAMTNFDSNDVMRFLGKKLNPNYQGEVITDLKRRREGARVKHYVGANSQKVYDKALPVAPVRGVMPAVLRFENTMNDPSAFRVRRKAQGDPKSETKLRSLRKGIVDLRRRAKISQQVNDRHANAMAVVTSDRRVHDLVDPITKPADLAGRRVRAMRPWAAPDLPLLKAVASGDFLINGFRNRDVHAAVFATPHASEADRKRRTSRVAHLLRILRGHGIIAKIEGTHRYQVTDKGREVIAAVIATDQAALSKLAQCA